MQLLTRLVRERILHGAPVSAGAIILRERDGEIKVALAHRRFSPKPWVLPKGHSEPGETPEEAAKREVHEETGIADIQLIKLLGTVVRNSPGKNNRKQRTKTIYYYLAYALDGRQPTMPTDPSFGEAGWFSLREALERLRHEEERLFFQEHLTPLFE